MENDFITRMADGWGTNKQKGYTSNIEKLTLKNKNYRKVLYTAPGTQLVLMTLQPGEQIGEETHYNIDQFFRIESGTGIVIINGRKTPVSNGSAIIIPRGSRHNVINTGRTPMKLYTLYSPPNHMDGFMARTKATAEKSTETFTGKTTE